MKAITDLDGVYASGVSCGIKKSGLDLAYIFVPDATSCAGVYTRNAFRGACIEHTRSCIQNGHVKAVIINSGNSNVATGTKGEENVARTAAKAASLLQLSPEQVAVSSTGIIGKQLPIEKLKLGLEELLANPFQKNGTLAAEAILTTDLRKKTSFRSCIIDGQEIWIGGFAKGSGMIAPNMGTMLAYLVINTAIPQSVLQMMLASAADASFNMVSVDTDTSTSDMVLLFSTSEHTVDLHPETLAVLRSLIEEVCVDLAKMIARDGEGAEKLLEAEVTDAASVADARSIALSIVSSPLVKAAVHGADPNWGRVIMALGKTPNVRVDPNRVEVYFGPTKVFGNGQPCESAARELVAEYLKNEEVSIRVCLNLGTAHARAWGCDLTKRYVEINVDYN